MDGLVRLGEMRYLVRSTADWEARELAAVLQRIGDLQAAIDGLALHPRKQAEAQNICRRLIGCLAGRLPPPEQNGGPP